MTKDNVQELADLNIIPNSGVVFDTFGTLYSDALYCDYNKPSEYMRVMWERYTASPNSNNKNGKIFESIFATLLYREKILPIFVQAKIVFVPNVNFDFVIYSKEIGPISLSLKTSLRERYKQADLESIALKYVHRKSKSYLFTLHQAEAASVRKKIKSGDVMGIDDVFFVSSDAFDSIIKELKGLTLHEPQEVKVITSQKVIRVSS